MGTTLSKLQAIRARQKPNGKRAIYGSPRSNIRLPTIVPQKLVTAKLHLIREKDLSEPEQVAADGGDRKAAGDGLRHSRDSIYFTDAVDRPAQ